MAKQKKKATRKILAGKKTRRGTKPTEGKSSAQAAKSAHAHVPLKDTGAGEDLKVLDLTGEPVHPVVKLPEGDFEMLTPEELTFEQFGRQAYIGRQITQRAPHVLEDGVMEELQELVKEAAGMILIDLTDKAARNLTPGRYLKINDFFNGFAGVSE